MKLNTIQELEKAALDIRVNLLRLCNKEVIHIRGGERLKNSMLEMLNK